MRRSLPAVEAGDVHHRHNAADDDRKLAEVCFGSSSDPSGLSDGAEIDRRRFDLRDAAARADRLIVDLVAVCFCSRPPRPKGPDRRRWNRRR